MANKNGIKYEELAKAKISEKRSIVISKRSHGGFTVAQQIEVEEDGKSIEMFLKGAFQVTDLDGLHNMRDALTCAINMLETESDEVESEDDDKEIWDGDEDD